MSSWILSSNYCLTLLYSAVKLCWLFFSRLRGNRSQEKAFHSLLWHIWSHCKSVSASCVWTARSVWPRPETRDCDWAGRDLPSTNRPDPTQAAASGAGPATEVPTPHMRSAIICLWITSLRVSVYVCVCLPSRLLLRISQRSFQMVLVDKQGIDKQRYPFPITAAELFTTIDTFPLRKDEMPLQQEAGQSCQS